LYICEKCGKQVEQKYGSGRFCSRSCANSRIRTEEIKNKISDSCKGKFKSWRELHPDEWKQSYKKSWITKKQKILKKNEESLKHKEKTTKIVAKKHHTIKLANCAYCGKQIDITYRKKNINNRYFCNGTCRNLLLNSTKEIGGLFKGFNTSNWERQVQELLKKYGIEFEANKRDLIPSHYEIDIWLPQQKIAIELNGIWHYSSKPYNGDEEALKKKQQKDVIKKQEVENLGYRFFAFEDRNIDDVEKFFENFIKKEILF
jgi:very-short-patch-repair endonuclease